LKNSFEELSPKFSIYNEQGRIFMCDEEILATNDKNKGNRVAGDAASKKKGIRRKKKKQRIKLGGIKKEKVDYRKTIR
jgi:hypothetical protein